MNAHLRALVHDYASLARECNHMALTCRRLGKGELRQSHLACRDRYMGYARHWKARLGV